jgi:hypothetical protein
MRETTGEFYNRAWAYRLNDKCNKEQARVAAHISFGNRLLQIGTNAYRFDGFLYGGYVKWQTVKALIHRGVIEFPPHKTAITETAKLLKTYKTEYTMQYKIRHYVTKVDGMPFLPSMVADERIIIMTEEDAADCDVADQCPQGMQLASEMTILSEDDDLSTLPLGYMLKKDEDA